ncbi:MAG: Holliday junction branch migration protein RuvA [Lachnospiraceae bacterium]|nr:Holliday junction branch migration protein RuvA [Lachnospiraceae bacterium]
MIAYIKGIVETIDCEEVVLDKDGIGFRIFTSQNVTNKLRIHDSVTLFTYMNVREDDISLYGFLTKEEQSVFKLLIGISGIGPKGALSVLSTLTVDELRIAVLSEDYKAIAKANGIGAKTAQRVVIDLKDKFKLEDVLDTADDTANVNELKENDNVSEAALALTGLGYSNLEALRAIKKVKGYENMSVEELLKNSLKNMI